MRKTDLAYTHARRSINKLLNEAERELGVLHENVSAINQARETLSAAYQEFSEIKAEYDKAKADRLGSSAA